MINEIAGLHLTLENTNEGTLEAAPISDTEPVSEFLTDREGCPESMALGTCQRFEVYGRGERAVDALRDLQHRADALAGGGCLTRGNDTVDHVFRVASGLESSILGEDEVLGQLRNAYRTARERETLDGTLEATVLKAIHVGQRVRDETAIGDGSASIGSLAVDRTRAILDGFEGAVVLVLGAGTVASLVVDALRPYENDVELVVANRSPSSAEELASRCRGSALSIDRAKARLEDIDVILSATGAAEPVLTKADLESLDLLVLDLATPRDVDHDVGELPGIDLHTLTDVRATHRASEQRCRAVPAAERILEGEHRRLEEQLNATRIDESLARIRSKAERIRRKETEHAFRRLHRRGDLTPAQEDVIEEFASALVSKLLHPPTVSLRRAAENEDFDVIESGLQLFSAGTRTVEGHTPGRERQTTETTITGSPGGTESTPTASRSEPRER